MSFLTYFTWPTASTTFENAAPWFNTLMSELQTPLGWAIGIGIFGTVVGFVMYWALGGHRH